MAGAEAYDIRLRSWHVNRDLFRCFGLLDFKDLLLHSPLGHLLDTWISRRGLALKLMTQASSIFIHIIDSMDSSVWITSAWTHVTWIHIIIGSYFGEDYFIRKNGYALGVGGEVLWVFGDRLDGKKWMSFCQQMDYIIAIHVNNDFFFLFNFIQLLK